MDVVHGRVLIDGEAEAELLVLTAALSFWGGVHPDHGTIIDPRHPQFGEALGGRVVLVPETVGSSSSSSILLELYRHECAPAALLLRQVDPILPLGAVVARELGYATCPIVSIDASAINTVEHARTCRVESGGRITLEV